MQPTGKGHVPSDLQERKHLTGKNHTADHQAHHRRQSKQVDCCLQDAGSGVFPLEKPRPPAPVEDMVENEQEEPPTHSWAVSPHR